MSSATGNPSAAPSPAEVSAASSRDVVLCAGAPARLARHELDGDVFGLRDKVRPGDVVVVVARHAPIVLGALAALEGWAGRVELHATRPRTTCDGALVVDDRDATRSGRTSTVGTTGTTGRETRWRLWSSGTSGLPRPTDHTLSSLTTPAQRLGGRGRCWGLLYQPTRMAGIQVLAQALAAGERVVDATHVPGLSAQLDFLADHGVDAISATPTMWRRILQSPSAARLRLRQVTLGGEIADQGLLDALRAAYDARITQVYASTEAGAVFAVSDGREGFPRRLLDAGRSAGSGRQVEVRDGVLHVLAQDSGAAGDDGYVSTGDLVEVRGDRVHFLGRASGLVNVGGDLVAPERVESLLREHPDVADAVVSAKRNRFTGNVLVAQVLLRRGTAVDTAPSLPVELRSWVAGRLPRACVPATVTIVPTLPTAASGKAART